MKISQPFFQDFVRDPKIQHGANGLQVIHGFCSIHGTASGGDHGPVHLNGCVDPVLNGIKPIDAILFQNQPVFAFLDQKIRIHKTIP